MMSERRLAVLLACYNRRSKTLAALERLAAQDFPDGLHVDIILVDDGSSDGTGAAVRQSFPLVQVLTGDGRLYWNGAMTLAQQTALRRDYHFHLWLNDDVLLFNGALAALVALHDQEIEANRAAPLVVGSTVDPDSGRPTYGGYVRRGDWHPLHFDRVFATGGAPVACDTFNGNCVLIPASAFRLLGANEPAYGGGQCLGDTDYGLRAGRAGIPMLVAPDPVGQCPGNDGATPWADASRTLTARLAALSGPHGPARRQVAAFYRRHARTFWLLWFCIHVVKSLMASLFPPGPAHALTDLAMIEPVLSWYRKPLLSYLRRRANVNVVLYHGSAYKNGEPDVDPSPETARRYAKNIYWPGGGDRVLWSNHVWTLLRDSHDVVMMAEHVYTLSNWLIWIKRRLLGRPRIVLTGHIRLDHKRDWLSGLRRVWILGADVLAPYTESGAGACRHIGFPASRIVVLNNTLDVESIRRVSQPSPDASAIEKRRLGLEGQAVFLFIGRLYPGKQSRLAAEAVRELNRLGHAAVLLVIGVGEDLTALRCLEASGYPLRLLGEQRDPEQLACWFSLAEAVLMPDAAGLAVVHAFAHGRPVVLGPGGGHGVEAEYVRHGENGLVAQALTAAALAEQLRRLLEEPGLRGHLRQGAVQTADGLTMERYTERVEAAVLRAIHD